MASESAGEREAPHTQHTHPPVDASAHTYTHTHTHTHTCPAFGKFTTCIDGDLLVSQVCVCVCVRVVAEGPDSLLGPQCPVEGQSFFCLFSSSRSMKTPSRRSRGVLQSERDDKNVKRKLVNLFSLS